jgi:hypothetical protein
LLVHDFLSSGDIGRGPMSRCAVNLREVAPDLVDPNQGSARCFSHSGRHRRTIQQSSGLDALRSTVGHGLEDAAVMGRDVGFEGIGDVGSDGAQRPLLVFPDEPTVTGDIGGENGGEAALDTFFGHVIWLPSEQLPGEIGWVADY